MNNNYSISSRRNWLALLIGMNLFSSALIAQKWKTMDNTHVIMQGYASTSAAAFDIDLRPYVSGDKNSVVTNNVVYYIWGIEDWEAGGGGVPAHQEAVGFSINNKGYIIGGIDENGNYKNEVWEFDPAVPGWTKKANFPGGARASAVVFVIANKAYVGSGTDGNTLYTDFYEYNPASDSWNPIAGLPGVARKNAIAFTADAKGYVGTGSDASNGVLNDLWEYDPSANQWTGKNNFSGSARTSAIGLGLGTKGYLGTGTNGTISYKDFWEYTPSTDSWTKLTDFPGEARNEAVAFVSGAKLCIAFGKNAGGTVLNDCYYYKNSYTYDYSLSKNQLCLGSTVVIKNLTTDPDAYKYVLHLDNGNRYVNRLDTVHYTPTRADYQHHLQIDVFDKSGLQLLGAPRHSLDIAKIDSISMVVSADTCTGGVGMAIARIHYPDIFGSMSPYKFEWSNNVIHASSLYERDTVKGLLPGSISVTVTDAAGCQASKSGMIKTYTDQPQVLFSVTADTCLGHVGRISAFPQTLKTPYTYEWSGNQTTASISNLSTGKYVLKFKDKNGCTAMDSTIVPLHLNKVKVGFTAVEPGCQASDGRLVAIATDGMAPYSFAWSTGVQKDTLDHIPAGKYKISVKDTYSCSVTDSFQLKEKNIAAIPAICMVTVDSTSKHNVIVWEKSNYINVDSFIVYREISTNTYKRIGAVSYQVFSSFTDTAQAIYFPNTGNPNAGTYRYKLQLLDKCGNYSTLSPYHNTIFITNNNGTFSWPQLYTIEGSANPVNNYVLLRDNLSNGNWKIIASVSGTQQTVTDPDYHTYKNTASYRVATGWNISCTPSRLYSGEEMTAAAASLSNIHGKSIVTGVDNQKTALSCELYPNPFTNRADVMVSGLNPGSDSQLRLFDYLGKEVKSQSVENGRNQLDRGNLSNGMYFLEIMENDTVRAKMKVIITN